MNTEIVKITQIDEKTSAEIIKCANVIRDGGLVVFPTETVYGLGADATNSEAVRKIYEAKGRPSDNPLIIHVASAADAEGYTYTTPMYYSLAEKFMPGPLTVILRSKQTVPERTRGGLDTVAVRCPSNEVARALISAAAVPIAAPSANLSGTPSPTKAEHVIKDMAGRVDIIIDSLDADFGLESTIVKIENDETLTLLRPGKITVEELLTVANEVKIADSVTDKLAEGAVALSPGMKYKHYAPRTPLILIDAEPEDFIEYVTSQREERIAVISYSEDIERINLLSREIICYDFGARDEASEHAHRLFSILRKTDDAEHSVIYAPLPRAQGIELALYNRMIRAAAHKIIRMRR